MAKSDGQETHRLEAFSDGVFSIVITLLALDLRPEIGIESPSSTALASALIGAWPTYLSFVLSFGSVLIMWINHHAMFRFAERVTNGLLFSNGLLLLLTTTVPFATGLLARQMLAPGSRVAAGIYAGLFLLINLSYNLVWRSIAPPQASTEGQDPLLRRLKRSYQLGFVGYVLALVLACWSAFGALAICVALWGLWAVNVQPVHRR